ncbi:hypothetical protein RB195_005300 [Necator americanus]|uniref:Uncharacterized protein n=2 Tax=Necator americanus TaxID=51031 RepID=A0ABR1BP03_NECAM
MRKPIRKMLFMICCFAFYIRNIEEEIWIFSHYERLWLKMRTILVVLLYALFLGMQCAVVKEVNDVNNIVRLKRAVVIAPPRPPVVVVPPRPPVVVVPPRPPVVAPPRPPIVAPPRPPVVVVPPRPPIVAPSRPPVVVVPPRPPVVVVPPRPPVVVVPPRRPALYAG